MFLKNSRNNELLLLTDTKLGGSGPSISQKPCFVKKSCTLVAQCYKKTKTRFVLYFLNSYIYHNNFNRFKFQLLWVIKAKIVEWIVWQKISPHCYKQEKTYNSYISEFNGKKSMQNLWDFKGLIYCFFFLKILELFCRRRLSYKKTLFTSVLNPVLRSWSFFDRLRL